MQTSLACSMAAVVLTKGWGQVGPQPESAFWIRWQVRVVQATEMTDEPFQQFELRAKGIQLGF